MGHVRLALAQLNTVVGDLAGNVDRVLAALSEAEASGADVCVMPELSITGYPPEDLLLKPGFVRDNVAALEKVAAATADCVAVVGFVEPLESAADDPAPWQPFSARLANAAAVCAGGRVTGIYRKRLLPNYGVFDEARWFTPGDEALVLYEIAGVSFGVTICEDVWFAQGPVPTLGRAGADVVVNLNSSPYSRGRPHERVAMLETRAKEADCAIAYVNQVGGQDELVFDGNSLVVDRDGRLLATGRQFESALVVVDLEIETKTTRSLERVSLSKRSHAAQALAAPPVAPFLDPLAEVYGALVLGTRDYLAKNGFSDAVVGLSGGIDSSLVATVAVDALGADRVHALSMPSRYSSDGSRTDAQALADALGIDLRVVPIEAAHVAFGEMLTPVLDDAPKGLVDENLQSRIRGVLLMAVSNARGWIVLTTGNKSELATGYSTLYGDSAGGFAVIKDVPKTLVYELCRHRNTLGEAAGTGAPIPQAVLDKAPSAELRPDQRDDESLPPYDALDPVLEAYVERDRTGADLVAAGFAPALVDQVVALVDGAEYKRRQMPPGVRITTKAFGKDRRMPITNRYRHRPSGEGG